jgi:glycine oxidase
MKNAQHPVVIIGSGLAGIAVALRLHARKIPFIVIDNGNNVSSKVAAGVINPIVFRRTTKSWRVDEFLPAAVQFYASIAAELGNNYYEPIAIRRGFSHLQEAETWEKKQLDPTYSPYLKAIELQDQQSEQLIQTFGTGVVLQAAYIHTQSFLSDAMEWLQGMNALRKETFEYNALNPLEHTYKGEKFHHFIFCEGYQGIYNPWFNYLPLEATKGETLTIRSTEIPSNELLNRKCFILPLGNDLFRVGATYTWRTPDTELTQEARDLLVEQVKSLVQGSFQVVEQHAGIRPTVLDRRPLMGTHPTFTSLSIFNGLGAKGYLLAPLLSEELMEYLVNGHPLDRESDIKRYENRITQP